VRCLRDERDGTNRPPGGGRGPARGAVAAPTWLAAVLGLHRVRSTAPIDRCPGMLAQRPHRFTWPLSLDDWALPFIHFGQGLSVRSLLIAGSNSVVAPVVAGVLRFGFPTAGADPHQAATPLCRRHPSLQCHG
jgi:hypothetical protein